MRASLCAEFLDYLDADGELAVGPSPKHFADWLDQADLPSELHHLLRFNWPQKGGYLGNFRVVSAEELLADEFREHLLPHQFLLIGWAANGDPLVVRCGSEQCEVGFICHEKWDLKENPSTLYQPIARSLDSFLYRVVEGRFIPLDYFAALDLNAFLAEEKGHTR